ncbi:ABC-three component system middle component 5 [Mesorhizobium sp. WSM3626]|uniref:ABC-three component system middle component 5 n=1 Tax=Mesorhizobium sp. WSM3626 TaxID=1040987 RepID=UPI00048419D1|nr:ABC-three component system middle component 5 [Mesorhizobium sp. WSM3626]
MTYRLWYAQLDLFDTARRYLALLSHWKGEPPNRDRLFVSDFYLVNPSLLHLTHMSADVRRTFTALRIPKPDETFIQYPSPPILYTKMGGIQTLALHNLVGKGLVELEPVNRDRYGLSEHGRDLVSQLGYQLVLPGEEEILNFLVTDYVAIGRGKGGLRSMTGLRRIGT